MRTALRRARRLGAFLLVTVAAGWVVLRRRSPVTWIEPAPGSAAAGAPGVDPAAEIGAPGEVPEDVLATDAGLTELPSPPDDEAVPAPSGTVVVDEVLVGELLADVPADREVDEAAFEQALVDATPAPSDATPAPSDATPAPSDATPAPSDATPAVAGDEELVDADPLTPAPFTPEPEIAESGPSAETDALPEPVVMEPAGADPAPFEAEAADAPAVADFPSSGVEPVGEAAAAEAVAAVVAAEPVEAVVADEPGVTGLDDDDPTDTGLTAPELTASELGIDEPTMTIARDAIAAGKEETGTRIPMPTFSEAPTMEIPAVTDDLRAVRGIGPSMERMLHGLGIISFRQLAMLDGVELERVRAELSDFRTRIERENWVGQARDLHREKYGREPGSPG